MSYSYASDGWERLPNGFDVKFIHSIPVRLADNGKGLSIPEQILTEEISALGKLHVEIGEWEDGEKPDEHEAPLLVSSHQIKEVLRRLALSSAALFFDRYKKAIDRTDVDWDEQEYRKDFGEALAHCGLDRDDLKQIENHDEYIAIMHAETRRLAQLNEAPLIEPE